MATSQNIHPREYRPLQVRVGQSVAGVMEEGRDKWVTIEIGADAVTIDGITTADLQDIAAKIVVGLMALEAEENVCDLSIKPHRLGEVDTPSDQSWREGIPD